MSRRKLVIRSLIFFNGEEDVLSLNGSFELYDCQGYRTRTGDLTELPVDKPKYESGMLVHILANKRFMHPSYVKQVEFMISPKPEHDNHLWETWINEILSDPTIRTNIEEVRFKCCQRIQYWLDISTEPSYTVEKFRQNELVKVDLTICDECGSIRCQYAPCQSCGSDRGIPKWIVIFSSREGTDYKDWKLQYDKYTKATIRRRAKSFVKRKKLELVGRNTKPYNGIFVLSPRTIAENVSEALAGAANVKALNSLTQP